MPAWIEPLFELLWKHSEIAAKESWELVSPGSPCGENLRFDDLCVQSQIT